MATRKVIWGGLGLLATGALLVQLAYRGNAEGSAPPDPVAQAAVGKKAIVFLHEGVSPQPEFDAVYAFDGQVTAASETGIILRATAINNNGFTLFNDGSRKKKVQESEYKAGVVIPWSAVKYVKILE